MRAAPSSFFKRLFGADESRASEERLKLSKSQPEPGEREEEF